MKNKYWGYQTDDSIRIPVPVIADSMDHGTGVVFDSNNGDFNFAQRQRSSFFAKKVY